MKTAYKTLFNNKIEVWLGLLLFVGIPAVLALYLDWRAFLAASFFAQSTILILSVYKDAK